ncbi:unnamed protein product, partial [Allacma fusca]
MLTITNISLVAIFSAWFMKCSVTATEFYFGDENVTATQIITRGSNCSEYQVIFETGGQCFDIGGAYNDGPCGNGTIGQSPTDPKL